MNTPHGNVTPHRHHLHAPRFPFGQPVDSPAEQFANWLPYSAYLAAEKIFVNRDSLGFMLELMPQYRSIELGVYAVYPTRKHLSPKVRALIEFLTQRLGEDRAVR